MMGDDLIRLQGLSVHLPTGPKAEVQAVCDVTLAVARGQRVGLVGESGSGKSVTGRSIAGLLPDSKRVRVGGSIVINGTEMAGAKPKAWARIRREMVSMIFQDPLSSLNPTMRVGKQVAEAVRNATSRADRAKRTEQAMQMAGLSDPAAIAHKFPFELSGGLRQRILIAIALAKEPALIIADEPTTALDVTVQKKILETLKATVDQTGAALIMISHDLGVVADLCDYVYVMQRGQIVEHGETVELFTAPQHPYTQQLLQGARDLLSVAEVPAISL